MAYTRVNWENLPSTNTPVNATNLNKMDAGIANLDTNKLDKAVNVTTANTNLNDYKEDGEFYFGVNYTPTNIPAGSNGWLKVITGIQGSDNVVKQIWYRHGTPSSNDYETYVRTFSGGSWGNWRRTDGGNFLHLGANATTYSFSIGNLTGGFQTYIIYGGWAKHFVYLLTIHPSQQAVIGYNQIFNNTGEANINSVTMSNNIITITFSSTIWGGIHVIGEQAQST